MKALSIWNVLVPGEVLAILFSYVGEKDMKRVILLFQKSIYPQQILARKLAKWFIQKKPQTVNVFPNPEIYRNISGGEHDFFYCIDVCWTSRFNIGDYNIRYMPTLDPIHVVSLLWTSCWIHKEEPPELKDIWQHLKGLDPTVKFDDYRLPNGKMVNVLSDEFDPWDVTGC